MLNTRRSEDRRQVRLILSPQVQLVVKPGFRPQWATIHDLSTAGIGIVVGRALDPGTVVAIQLRAPSHQSLVRVAEVRHATPRGTRAWLLGCAFSQPILLQDVIELTGVD